MVHTRCITESFDSFFFLGGVCFYGWYLISPSIPPGLRTVWRKKTSARNSGIQKNIRVLKQFSDVVIKKFCGKNPFKLDGSALKIS